MVHVISAHHFGGQEIVTIDHPLAIATGPDNVLFVSTPDHQLHILNIATGEPVKPPFSTVDAAVSICYSQHGGYVAALEAKEARHSPDFSYIRVYRHWAQQERAQPMRARIAARVTPSSGGAHPGLEMIEVPISEQATAIACCQRTGNLAVACGSLVTLHQFVMKTHDISRFQFCDLEEVAQLELAFEVTELALCEELLVCAGAEQLQLLQLSELADRQTPPADRPPQLPEEEQLDDGEDQPRPAVWGPPLRLAALHRPLLTAADAGPRPRLLVAAGRPPLDAVSLLYWRQPDGDELVPGALCLTPFYDRAEPLSADALTAGGCLRCADRSQLSGVSVFFSSRHEGRLYQVAPLSAGGATLVATHTYTAPLVLAVRQQHMLHALTLTGLESYTVRDTRRLARLQRPGDPAPDPAATGCLLGLQPFLGVTHLATGGGILALVAAAEESDSATLYLLRLPGPLELYSECARLAGTHGQHAPAMCLALLEEAHMVLRPAVAWQDGPPLSERLSAEYRRSAANIGFFLLRSACEGDWEKAAPWLRLAEATVEDVLAQCAEAVGLASYLSGALAATDQPLLAYQTANQALAVLAAGAPELLGPALLAAGPLAEYCAEPPLEALLQLLEEAALPEPAAQAARLAALLLLARSGGGPAERRRPLLAALSEEALPAGRPHLLLTADGRLTELAELLAEGRPGLLAAGLAALAAAGDPPLPRLVALLLEAADTSDRRAALRYELLLRDLLERHLQAGGRPPPCAAPAVTLLLRMYLSGTVGAGPLAEPPEPSLRRHRLGPLYGPRATWMNLLPPFAGRTPAQLAADMETEPRLVELVMLQSLLCSELPSADDRRHLGQFLEEHPEALGRDALQALCSPLAEAAELVAARHPEAALEHARARCHSAADWRAVLGALCSAGQPAALAAVLDHLASALPPDQLREALAGRADQHQQCLLRCHSTQRADFVRAEIMRMA